MNKIVLSLATLAVASGTAIIITTSQPTEQINNEVAISIEQPEEIEKVEEANIEEVKEEPVESVDNQPVENVENQIIVPVDEPEEKKCEIAEIFGYDTLEDFIYKHPMNTAIARFLTNNGYTWGEISTSFSQNGVSETIAKYFPYSTHQNAYIQALQIFENYEPRYKECE